MTPWRSFALTFALSMAAAGLGVWGGARYVLAQNHWPAALHDILHASLHLTREQQNRIAGLERDRSAKRKALEAEMRAANVELAKAYRAKHAYSPSVQAAIDHFHRAMAALQKDTVMHVIAMRSVLRPDQTAAFDASVARSLTGKGS